jgi:hypothetical protein
MNELVLLACEDRTKVMENPVPSLGHQGSTPQGLHLLVICRRLGIHYLLHFPWWFIFVLYFEPIAVLLRMLVIPSYRKLA